MKNPVALLTGRVTVDYRGNYRWVSKEGDHHQVSRMAAAHLFYAMRMLYNHSCPPAFRILRPCETFNRYEDIFQQDIQTKRSSFSILQNELDYRLEELPADLLAQYSDLKANRLFLHLILGY